MNDVYVSRISMKIKRMFLKNIKTSFFFFLMFYIFLNYFDLNLIETYNINTN